VVIISAVTLGMLLLKWKDLMLLFFDESQARAVGLRPTALKVMVFA
jgi:manganese/iron transport system permease protein